MNEILALIGWLAIVVVFIWWLCAFGIILFDNCGKYNIGGVPNSPVKRVFVFLLCFVNIAVAIQIGILAPFTVTF